MRIARLESIEGAFAQEYAMGCLFSLRVPSESL